MEQIKVDSLTELVGQRYGMLEIISVTRGRLGGVKCQCRCDCGTEKEIRFYLLENAIVTGCGCQVGRKKGHKIGLKNEIYVSPIDAHLLHHDHLKKNHPLRFFKLAHSVDRWRESGCGLANL